MPSLANPTFSIPQGQIEDLKKVLNPSQFRQACFQVVKRTTQAGAQLAAKAVLEKLAISRKDVYRATNQSAQQAIRTGVSKGDVPVGEIVIEQIRIPLSSFKLRRNGKSGVAVVISRDRPAVVLKHAFFASVASSAQAAQGISHKGIFLRKRLGPASRERGDKHFPGRSSKVTPRGYAWRLPIRETYGMSVLDVISKDEVNAAVMAGIGDTLQKNIDSQVNRFLQVGTLAEAVADAEQF